MPSSPSCVFRPLFSVPLPAFPKFLSDLGKYSLWSPNINCTSVSPFSFGLLCRRRKEIVKDGSEQMDLEPPSRHARSHRTAARDRGRVMRSSRRARPTRSRRVRRERNIVSNISNIVVVAPCNGRRSCLACAGRVSRRRVRRTFWGLLSIYHPLSWRNLKIKITHKISWHYEFMTCAVVKLRLTN